MYLDSKYQITREQKFLYDDLNYHSLNNLTSTQPKTIETSEYFENLYTINLFI